MCGFVRISLGYDSFFIFGSTDVSDCAPGSLDECSLRTRRDAGRSGWSASNRAGDHLVNIDLAGLLAQKKPNAVRCSAQMSGMRVSVISLLAVSAMGWRPFRIAMTISGARKFNRISRAA